MNRKTKSSEVIKILLLIKPQAIILGCLLISIMLIPISPINTYAKDLGVMGETYSIQETDFIDFIKNRVIEMEHSGELKAVQDHLQKRAMIQRDRPTPLLLPHVAQAKTVLFNPSIVLDHDIQARDGEVIAKAGTIINPLTIISLSKTLIFYDADDVKERKWVAEIDKKLKGREKLILVKGSILTEESRLKRRVYFDQEGKLTSRLGVKRVPTVVEQAGLLLRLKEILL